MERFFSTSTNGRTEADWHKWLAENFKDLSPSKYPEMPYIYEDGIKYYVDWTDSSCHFSLNDDDEWVIQYIKRNNDSIKHDKSSVEPNSQLDKNREDLSPDMHKVMQDPNLLEDYMIKNQEKLKNDLGIEYAGVKDGQVVWKINK